jgi:hypothetical protein
VSNVLKGRILKASALMIDVGVPLAVTLTQFPVWVHRNSESTISGLFLIFAFLCFIPFIRQIKAFVQNPSAPLVWAVMFAIFSLLRNIIDEMVWICAFGVVSNAVGTVLYKVGESIENKEEASEEAPEGQEEVI